MKRILLSLVLIVLVSIVIPPPVQARNGWHGRGGRYHDRGPRVRHRGFQHRGFRHRGFQHRGFRHRGFRHRGFQHRGYWYNGVWFWYPVYPYPGPYAPSVIVQTPQSPPVAQPQSPVWYYCDQAAGYYPYVPECPSGWRTVPATPPASSVPATPLPPPAEPGS